MADTDENPKWRGKGRSGGRWSGGVRGRELVRTERPGGGTRDVSWVRRAVWGRTRSLTRCCSGMGYCTGAEHKVVTNENGRRWGGAALSLSGEARCQGSALQEWRTGRRIYYSDTLVQGSWLMVLRMRSRRDCWERQVATLVFSSPVLRGHVSVVPLWGCFFHLTAGVCGLSTDMLHGDEALCMARWCCIDTLGLTRALL